MKDRLCHSQNHRAVLQLFRAAHGLALSESALADIHQAAEEDLVRISSAHGITPIMADGLDHIADIQIDRDLQIFWQEMREGNRQRNLKMKAQLREAAAILAGEHIPVVVLKGGCDLVLASPDQFHRRFVGDLDLLVTKADLQKAVSTLTECGYQNAYADDEFYHAPDHHDAPLISPDWPAAVEVHRAIGGDDGERFLAASDIRQNAQGTSIANLNVPSPLNRLRHAVFHGQIQDAGYQDRLISLRTIADLVVLATDRQLVLEARQTFVEAGLGPSFDGMLAAAELLLPGLLPPLDHDKQACGWARDAVRRFGTPRRASLDRQARNVARWVRGFATDPELRSVYGSKILKPGRFRRMAQTLRNMNRQ